MSTHTLSNELITIQLNEFGAELTSIKSNSNNTEYLWNGDPSYWKRQSPILFPFVGSVKNKSYSYKGKTYPMSQHGFARDMKFSLISRYDNEIWLSLEATKETLKVYPYMFRLELGYRIEGKIITVLWRVINKDNKTMYFSIGGHPAFNCPIEGEGEQSDYYLRFDTEKPIHYILVNEDGMAVKKPFDQQSTLTTDNGLALITPHMFDMDALIIEDNQCHEVSLLDPSKKPYVTLSFNAPLFGIWSPAKKNAPFICIEPWYGRCDSSDFEGSLAEREWGNKLEAGQQFEASYTIIIK
ncbi:MAG: aldose 1-epimerase family protein [Clostridiales bacterium]|nr:aldose 1-epimerase family protein [Clostridiales bacterium]